MSLMGLDIGTTGVKAVVFREDGDVLSSAYRSYDELFPAPGWVEMNPNQIWNAICEVVKQAAGEAASDPVRAIGCAALGEAVTPIDKDLRPLYNTIPSVDARCKAQVDWWERTLGVEAVLAITGQPLHTSYSINKVMWLRDQMPEVFSNTWKFLLWEDLFCCWMGVTPSIEYSLASRTMAFDIHSRCWSDRMLDAAGLSPDLLAQAVPAGMAAGEIPSRQAAELGLSRGVIVTAAGHDVINGALGAGVIRDGQALLTIGTTESVVVALDRPRPAKDPHAEKYACYCHVVPQAYAALAYSTCSGNLLRWYRDHFAKSEQEAAARQGMNVYDLLTARANLGRSGLLLLPHFIGSGTPYLDPDSRGALLGLGLATEPGDILAAILEGTTFELKVNLEAFERAGIGLYEMRAIGGGAKSDRWLQLKADITGRPISRLAVDETGCLGAAIQAGVACGVFASHEEALGPLIKIGPRFEPNPRNEKYYADLYAVYKDLYSRVRPISQKLSKLR